jgi:CelD/BcsL family acetyltransferase involved in cellulose biosynthesis
MTQESAMVPPAADRCANAIFQQPWWLDAVAPGSWAETTVERDGQVLARLPYAVRGRRRLRVLTMPPLTPTLGPWVRRSEASPPRALSQENELLGELVAALPSAHVFRQQFSPTMLNGLPFHWAGYRLQLRYTYRLEGLQSDETLWNGLRGNIRRAIRKGRRLLVMREDRGLDEFHAIWAKTFARQGLQAPASLADLERIDAACAAHDARAMLFAVDEADRVHAVAYGVWDEQGAYYLLGGGDPELRNSGATSLLLWELIMRARAVTDVFDFEGSMIEPLERFFRSFGARQTPYLYVSRMTPRGSAAVELRAGWHRVSRVLAR